MHYISTGYEPGWQLLILPFLLSLSLRLSFLISSISSLTDLDYLDISDTSDIEDFNMSATDGAAAGAAILPSYGHPGIQSGFAGLSRQTLLDMQNDPARIIRTFNGSYKYMKLQPNIELLDGANNYGLWCQWMIYIRKKNLEPERHYGSWQRHPWHSSSLGALVCKRYSMPPRPWQYSRRHSIICLTPKVLQEASPYTSTSTSTPGGITLHLGLWKYTWRYHIIRWAP